MQSVTVTGRDGDVSKMGVCDISSIYVILCSFDSLSYAPPSPSLAPSHIQMQSVTVTGRDGHVSQMEFVYIRGSKIRFFVIPDMLKNAPFFKKTKDNAPVGRGKTAILRAQGTWTSFMCFSLVACVFPLMQLFYETLIRTLFIEVCTGESEAGSEESGLEGSRERELSLSRCRTTQRYISSTGQGNGQV